MSSLRFHGARTRPARAFREYYVSYSRIYYTESIRQSRKKTPHRSPLANLPRIRSWYWRVLLGVLSSGVRGQAPPPGPVASNGGSSDGAYGGLPPAQAPPPLTRAARTCICVVVGFGVEGGGVLECGVMVVTLLTSQPDKSPLKTVAAEYQLIFISSYW